jgi:UDP:flavonoid glycosyltransferase YjiC (YdhE family)
MTAAETSSFPNGDAGRAPACRGTILIGLLPERGAYNASFTLAHGLETAGFRVVYVGPASFRSQIVAQGLEFVRIDADVDATSADRSGASGQLRRLREGVVEYAATLRRLEAWVEANPVVLVLLDPVMWQFGIPLLRRGIPVWNLNTTLASAYDPHVPPVFSSLVPGGERHLRAWFTHRGAWARRMILAYSRAWLTRLKLLLGDPANYRALNPYAAAKRSGVSLRWDEYGFRLAVPELVMSVREFDFPQVVSRAERTYIGASVAAGRKEMTFDWGGICRNRPLVYCSLGTYAPHYREAARFFRVMLNALCGQTKWQAIIHAGEVMRAGELGPMPPHVRIETIVPQLEVLRHSSVFITHGGFSSVREGIYFGVPMIVLPCRYDQFGNATRVAYHGLGVTLDIRHVDENLILQQIAHVATEPRIRRAIDRMQGCFRAQEDCGAGVAAILASLTKGAGEPKSQAGEASLGST